jgi:TRAP-type C4-dicarboxylate transport system permease small subunit
MKRNKGNSIDGLLGGLSRAFALASTATILLMSIIILIGFSFRALRLSLSGVNEATEFLVLIGIFLGFAYVQHRDTHIKAEIFTPMFPLWLRRAVGILSTLSALLFFSAMLYGGTISALESYYVGEYEVGLRSVPVWAVRAFIPIGSIAVILVSIGEMIKGMATPIHKDKEKLTIM